MKHNSAYYILIVLLILVSFNAESQEGSKKSFQSDLLFPKAKTKFQNDPIAHKLYDEMLKTIQKAETLSYDTECWLEQSKPESDEPIYSSPKIKLRLWMQKPNLFHLNMLLTKEDIYKTIIGDGDFFWEFWPDGLLRSMTEKWNNIYTRKLAEGYRFKMDVWPPMGELVIDPVVFCGIDDYPPRSYMDGVRKIADEKFNEEECEVIEVSFQYNQLSKYIWISKSDHLPRKLMQINRDFRRHPFAIITNEIWTNIKINENIPIEKFMWKPPNDWQRVSDSTLLSMDSLKSDSTEQQTGWINRGFFREEDFSIQYYKTFIPYNYNLNKAFPLVITVTEAPINTVAESREYIIVVATARERITYQTVPEIEDDILTIIAEMKAKYNIDPKRIYIMGTSNGGYTAYYIAFRNSELFAAVAAIASAIGTKVEVLPNLARAAKEHIPVYIVHGSKDNVVPISRANYMLFELKRSGYECEMLTLPEGGHSITVDTLDRILNFFDKHAKQDTPKIWDKIKRKKLSELPRREEKQIESAIKQYEKGYNKKDIRQIMSCFSKEYSDNGMEYLDIQDDLSELFIETKAVELKIHNTDTIVDTDDLSIIVTAIYDLKCDEKIKKDGNALFKFAKENGNWKIIGGNLCEL